MISISKQYFFYFIKPKPWLTLSLCEALYVTRNNDRTLAVKLTNVRESFIITYITSLLLFLIRGSENRTKLPESGDLSGNIIDPPPHQYCHTDLLTNVFLYPNVQ